MKKRTYAIAFSAASLCLGGIGIQKFYLRQFKRGFLYVVFFWTGIPYLFCVVDLLKFIFMDDKDFNIKYNDHNIECNNFDINNNVNKEYEYDDIYNSEDEIISNALAYYKSINKTLNFIKDYEFSCYIKQLNALFYEIIRKTSDNIENILVKKELEKMMEYNIPTTLKLINYYIDLIDSNNISEEANNIKKDIKDSIISVIEFLRNVLNKIYQNDIIDITSDIDVLKATLNKNGYV